MHPSSYNRMSSFTERFLASLRQSRLMILDLGSQDIHGSYKPLFVNPLWSYVGVDIAPGKNVDLVLSDIYRWTELADDLADVIVSGQTFEHIEFFWLTMAEIRRVLKPNGLLCIVAPSSGFEHRHPVDCWRFYPDGMRALAKSAGLEVLDVTWSHEDRDWNDVSLVARKK
ncbi:MAG: methyltransferase domain-containing protein [Lentisphaerae bacterium]|nr:methyltransferase domain-containing protein [Lentisphaerota bacterium]